MWGLGVLRFGGWVVVGDGDFEVVAGDGGDGGDGGMRWCWRGLLSVWLGLRAS